MLKTIDFVAGDTVRVSQKIKDGDKTRIQVFEGVVLQIIRKLKKEKNLESKYLKERFWA